MNTYQIPIKNKKTILALGAESAGNFSVYENRNISHSQDFNNLIIDTNFNQYKKELNKFLAENKIKPDIILVDLHPLYRTTALGEELSKKYKAKQIKIQHHLAHIFSSVGEKIIQNSKFKIQNSIGIALDGIGYGLDGKIWGGEIFQLSINNYQLTTNRIGHLDNQIMISGDLAVKEPARMLLAILNKFLGKKEVFKYINKYYTKNEFEVLYNQLQNNFNCQETSSTGRILDAVSILLGFCTNKRSYKHEPIDLLEQNSTFPYKNIKPKIIKTYSQESGIIIYELSTTFLFAYLIKYLQKNINLSAEKAGRLAATAQYYITKGLYEIIKMQNAKCKMQIFLSGGISNNKIISSYLEQKGAFANKKIPRGDAGLSFGQIIHQLFAS